MEKRVSMYIFFNARSRKIESVKGGGERIGVSKTFYQSLNKKVMINFRVKISVHVCLFMWMRASMRTYTWI